jgi:[pyruvate, water dikinase]-phosphate phosphotransferase / [pyruvate, water dikinase] kinase
MVEPHEKIAIHVLSDSLGETGETVALAAMAQFSSDAFRIERLERVTTPEQLRTAVREHCGRTCLFLYTLVNDEMREEMNRMVVESGVNAVDVIGPSVHLISKVTGLAPTGEVGATHRTDADYFERIEALEFAVKHDDGRNPQGMVEADIVLIGVSRTSKTPLSMYLAFKGLRVANVPLALGVAPPEELFELDRRRIFGLVSSSGTLSKIRTERMRELGIAVPHYADAEQISRELEEARSLMRRLGCLVINTDGRAVEETAQEISRYVGEAPATGD